jgi:hypothetical protein
MKNKNQKKNDNIDMLEIIASSMMYGSGLISLLGEAMKDPRDKDIVQLGHGITLQVDKDIKDNRDRYSRLVRNDQVLSDKLFRLGGLDHGFDNKPYASLIVYPDYPKDTWGNHCIIDINGKVVLEAEKFDSSLYYIDGIIAKKKETFINLLTGQPILKTSGNYFKSSQFMFIEHRYDFEKLYPLGVYKLDYRTGEYEIFK